MTNFEKFKDKILKLIDDDITQIAIKKTTGELVDCDDIYCENCLFQYTNCNIQFIKWLYEEYKPIIKPCPFCGKTDTIKIKKEENQYVICCSVHKGGCGSSSGYYNSEIEAIDKWNQRV